MSVAGSTWPNLLQFLRMHIESQPYTCALMLLYYYQCENLLNQKDSISVSFPLPSPLCFSFFILTNASLAYSVGLESVFSKEADFLTVGRFLFRLCQWAGPIGSPSAVSASWDVFTKGGKDRALCSCCSWAINSCQSHHMKSMRWFYKVRAVSKWHPWMLHPINS